MKAKKDEKTETAQPRLRIVGGVGGRGSRPEIVPEHRGENALSTDRQETTKRNRPGRDRQIYTQAEKKRIVTERRAKRQVRTKKRQGQRPDKTTQSRRDNTITQHKKSRLDQTRQENKT